MTPQRRQGAKLRPPTQLDCFTAAGVTLEACIPSKRGAAGLAFGNTSARPRYPLATRRSASVDGTRNLRQTTVNRRKRGAAQTHHQRQGGGVRYRGRQEARQLQQERVVRHPHQHLPTSTAVGQPIESVKRDSRGGAISAGKFAGTAAALAASRREVGGRDFHHVRGLASLGVSHPSTYRPRARNVIHGAGPLFLLCLRGLAKTLLVCLSVRPLSRPLLFLF